MLTDEMKQIINSNDKHMAIIAFAGSGKSSTMLEYIKQRPNEKILFLVYNKEMQREFSNRVKHIKHNATISTIHSFAFRWYVKRYGKRKFKNISSLDIKNILNTRGLEFGDLCLIKFYYDMFLCSDKETPYELQLISSEHLYLMKYVERLFNYYKNESDTIQHNVYLKLFQLSKDKINGYDTIIVDEFNDINECMLSVVVNNMDKKIICVGDPLQNLNSFNYTIDGLNKVIEDYGFKQYGLTMSFRISEEVANLSSRYLTYMYDKDIKFHGNKTTKFGKVDFKNCNPNNKITLLCRNRLGGLIEAMNIVQNYPNKRIYYVGGLDSFGLEEIERLISYRGYVYIGGEKFHISTLREMLDDEEVQDAEIRRIVSLYSFGQREENNKLFPLLRYTETTNKDEADIVIQTAHSAKGLTVSNVYLAGDFAPIEDLKKDMLEMKSRGNDYMYNVSKSEINLIYVALTRATEIIDMNDVLNRKDKQDKSKRIDVVLDNRKI